MSGGARPPDEGDPAAGRARPMAAGARPIVKVCGVTRLEDAHAAIEVGVDWLGVILSGDSPRRITPEHAAGIASELPGVTMVAVMVGVQPTEALDLARRAGAQRVQIHRPSMPWPDDFAMPAAIAVPVGPDGRLEAELPPTRHLLMLDTAHGERTGGTGQTFPWEAAVPLARQRLVMIAGGLGPENVAEAIRQVRPFGVDASSSLEISPGIKDRVLIRRFVLAVRETDRETMERTP